MASETNETREKSLNFLEEIIEESIAKGETRTDPFPTRTERLPAYRTRQEHLHQLRTGEEIRRQV